MVLKTNTDIQNNHNIRVQPILSLFLSSLRDIGYSFEMALADLVDNSISASAANIYLYALPSIDMLAILDDGLGMSDGMLIEAMRLGTQKENRGKNDLGRFGLGLKTASFSQCRKLTVFSYDGSEISGYTWDLDILSQTNEWLLQKAHIEEFKDKLASLDSAIYNKFTTSKHASLVIWETIDRYSSEEFNEELNKARKHLSLTFHRYLGFPGFNGQLIKLYFNNNKIDPFDPFTSKDKNIARAGMQAQTDDYKLSNGTSISVTPYILPPLNKLSQAEYKELATADGFTRSQGFYLYRQGRLLVYGTWFGLSCIKDASNLVRIRIDTDVYQDQLWKIDVKKSTAFPNKEIRDILRHYVNVPTDKSKKVHKASGIISKKTKDCYWKEVIFNDTSEFRINEKHPRYKALIENMTTEQKQHLRGYLACLEECYPKEQLHSLMTTDPYSVKERTVDENILAEEITEYKNIGKDKKTVRKILLADEYYVNAETLIDKKLGEIYE